MEQLYLIEIFVDKVTIFLKDDDKSSNANKNLIIKVRFGPKVQFILKEGQMSTQKRKDDVVVCDENGKRKYSRTVRVGKSYLFPSYPDTVLMILSKFPLEIEVWNDDDKEEPIYVGMGTMHWDTQFYIMLKECSNPRKLYDPLSIKQSTPLMAECCCNQCGEITFILRLSPLGDSITTEFQQLMANPELFVFRTDKAASMFQCKRIEGDDPNFTMVGSLYETTTLEDPDVQAAAVQKIEICTEADPCLPREDGSPSTSADQKKHTIDKIRMGDIRGPCGNTNCKLAHKVKTYIRSMGTYKAEAANKVKGNKDENVTKKICGTCCCKDDRYHRDSCPTKQFENKVECSGCGGLVQTGGTCDERKQKLFGTGATPTQSKTTVGYVMDSIFRNDFIVGNLEADYGNKGNKPTTSYAQGCYCRTADASQKPDTARLEVTKSKFNPPGYDNQYKAVYTCTQIPDDKDCRCDPVKPKPPCNTFDCDCITEIGNIATRKAHKAYCPMYHHKANCPVLMQDDEEKLEEDEDDVEPLPYGLPPIQLGPCPVLGRPCSVPEGFSRMYKNATLPTLPPSHAEAGKVCCSKEYQRIKKAIKQYMKCEKEHDFKCINKYNVDTETRCCDKEQRLKSLMGKECCGSHKMAIQELYQND